MNLDDLNAKTNHMEALRAIWEHQLLSAVASAVSDARAHAHRAIADATRDGRSSRLRLRSSPGLDAAGERLDGLRSWLTGDSGAIFDGAIRDAREAFYREAAALHFEAIPDEYKSRQTPGPPADLVAQVRAAAIHGFDPSAFLTQSLELRKKTLLAITSQAARTGAPMTDALAAWERTTSASLSRVVTTLLTDSLEYADREAGRDLIHVDARDDSPPEPV